MTIAIETIDYQSQEHRRQQDRRLAEIVGVEPEDMGELMTTRIVDLGHIAIQGTDERSAVMRFHCGPDGSIKRGGSKFKAYTSREQLRDDGIDHARSMFYKIGGIGEIEYAGGKTIANINPRRLTRNQMIDAMHQLASLMNQAGLADPRVDGTAGDEGTNAYIDHYVDALRLQNHPHPEACITGKSDMGPRAAATGRGAATVHRAWMRHHHERFARTAVQGSGFAGAYYAAEAYDPLDPADRDVQIAIPALGDLDPRTERPATLITNHPGGLPITRRMVDSILKNGHNDDDMKAEGGYKLAALARKIEREAHQEVQIVDRDVLTYEDAHYLAPAATSNVISRSNIADLHISNILEIGNHTVHAEAHELLAPLGFTLIAGELVNSGGVKMSIEENRRDLNRQAYKENGSLYLPAGVADEVYESRLRDTMITATKRAIALAEQRNLDISTAIKAVGLANYALAHGIRIDPAVKAALAA